MAWTPIIGVGMSLNRVQEYINGLDFRGWRPSGLVVHNTGAPSLAEWHKVSGETRMKNLEHYFKNIRGWPSAPHAFVADDLIWPFTPFDKPGTHSPSWNGTRIGIEMVADFSREDDDAGPGLKVKMNTVALFGMLHRKLGIDPETIKLHKEDPKTTHDCPGKDFNKVEFIRLVQEWMGHGGDHDDKKLPIDDVPVQPKQRLGTISVPNDVLNVREKSSASSTIVGRLEDRRLISILGEAQNGNTKWLRIDAQGLKGWVAARFVKYNTGG